MQPCGDCFPLRLDQVARLIMTDDLRYSSHGSCNDRRADCHSIQQRERQALLQRDLCIDRGSSDFLKDVVDKTFNDNFFRQASVANALFDGAPGRAIAENRKAPVGV